MIEVSPIALEESKFGTLKKWIKRISTPVVILGITIQALDDEKDTSPSGN